MPLALTSGVIVYKVLVKLLEKKKGEKILPGSDVWTPKWGPPMPHFSFLYLNFFLNDISVIVAGPTRVIMQQNDLIIPHDLKTGKVVEMKKEF